MKGHIMTTPRLSLTPAQLAFMLQHHDLIEDALDAGRITAADAEDLKRIDAVAKGKNPDDGSDVYLALEVSYVADQHDLERAIRRAGLLALATGAHAKAVIAGKTITAGAMSLAEERGAYVVTRE